MYRKYIENKEEIDSLNQQLNDTQHCVSYEMPFLKRIFNVLPQNPVVQSWGCGTLAWELLLQRAFPKIEKIIGLDSKDENIFLSNAKDILKQIKENSCLVLELTEEEKCLITQEDYYLELYTEHQSIIKNHSGVEIKIGVYMTVAQKR